MSVSYVRAVSDVERMLNEVWVDVDHIARGCRSEGPHDPTVYVARIRRSLDEAGRLYVAQRHAAEQLLRDLEHRGRQRNDALDALRECRAALKAARETYLAAVERFGVDRVLVPSMLGVEASKTEEAPT